MHDLSVILYLLDEEPEVATAQGSAFHPGVEDVVFCFLRFPSGKIAHMHLSWLDPHKMRKMTVVGREKMVVFDDMELERKVTVYEKRAERPRLRRVALRRHLHPEDRDRRAAAARVRALPRARRRRSTTSAKVARDGARVVRALEMLTNSLNGMAEIHPTAIVYPGTVLGEGVRVLENAVVGKQPSLGAPLDGEARAAAAGDDRRRHGRLDRRDRLRRLDDRRAVHRRRPVVHPRARRRSATTASSAAAR